MGLELGYSAIKADSHDLRLTHAAVAEVSGAEK